MQDFLAGALQHVAKHLKLNTLKLDKTTYIDENLQNTYSDLVYSCRYGAGQKLNVALLFEHKSYIPKHPHLQLLGYMLKIWETNVKQGKKLIPVIPILFYHGKKKFEKQKFNEYFEPVGDFLQNYIPHFDFEVIDTSALSDEKVKLLFKQIPLQTGLLLMKHIFDSSNELLEKLFLIFSDFKKLQSSENGKRFLDTTMIYFFSGTKLDIETVKEAAEELNFELGEVFDSTAYRLIKQGRLEGRLEGELEGIRKGRFEGELEGIRKGRFEGELEGIRKGRFEGELEGIRKKEEEIALKMIRKGWEDNAILEMAEISREHLKKLREKAV